MEISETLALRPISATSLKAVVFHYIPHQLLKSVDTSIFSPDEPTSELEILEKLLKNPDLRMYGTAEELANNLSIYRRFPSNHRIFGMGLEEMYNIGLLILKNEKGERFICKQDAYPYIQILIIGHLITMSGVPPDIIFNFPVKIMTICMKFHEERLDKCCEYVNLDLMRQFSKEIMNEIVKFRKRETTFNLDEWNPDNWAQKFMRYSEKAMAALDKAVNGEFMELTKGNDEFIQYGAPLGQHLVDTIEKIVESNPNMFLPNTKDTKNPITLRIFEDEMNKRFVMQSELYAALNRRNPGQKPLLYEDKEGLLYTMNWSDVQKVFGSTVDGIVLLRYPIKRTKHAAVPIMTPTGDYCILASDAFLQVLRHLIFALKVFQKINPMTWSFLVDYMKLMVAQFSSDAKCRYFITMERFGTIIEATDDFWREYVDTPTCEIRQVGKRGFDVEFLKQELRRMGLPRIFPEIEEFAPSLFEKTLKLTRNRAMTNTDLMDTLKHCQITMCFMYWPGLKEFLHMQEWRHPPCDKCLIPDKTFRFRCTKWNEYMFADVKLKLGKDSTKISLVCPDVQEFFPNYSILPHGPKGILLHDSKYFFLDQSDINWLSDNFDEKRQTELLYSLERFTAVRKNKKIYLRKIPIVPFRSTEAEATCGFFMEEVMEMVPVLLRIQKSTDFEHNLEANLDAFRKKLETSTIDENGKKWHGADLLTTTINQDELIQILDHFDINKNLITIVPDPCCRLAEREMLQQGGTPIINVTNPVGYRTLFCTQAIYHIFQSVVCNVDWSKDYCNIHHNCVDKFKEMVKEEMRRYTRMSQREYVLSEYVESRITHLQSHCNYKNRRNRPQTPLQKIVSCRNDGDYSTLTTVCPNIKEVLYATERDGEPPVWVARIELMRQWLEKFCDPAKDQDLMETTAYAFFFRMPVMDDMGIVQQMLNCTRISSPIKELPDEIEKPADPPKQEEVRIQKTPDPCSKCPELKIQLKLAESELNETKKAMKTVQDHTKTMEKKWRKLEETEKKLMTSEGKRKGLEKELEKTKKLETALKETMKTRLRKKDEEIHSLHGRFATIDNISKENEKMVQLVAESNEKQEKIEESNRILIENIDELTQKIARLEGQLMEISRKEEGPPTEYVSHRKTLLEYQKLQDLFRRNTLIEELQAMIDKLATVTQDEAIRSLAEYEMIQLKGMILIYTQTLEMNIQKIKKTNDISLLFPIPKRPAISRKFMVEYWRAMPRPPPQTGFSTDSACYYCHTNYKKGEKLFKCSKCKNRCHDKCGRQWVEEKEQCGYCREKMTIRDIVTSIF